MMSLISRRGFVSTASSLVMLDLWEQAANGQPPSMRVSEDFPAYDAALVKEVVTASHTNLPRVRELVERRPALARVSIDWGFGDVENCIDAASHMGRRDIAELLIANGARPTLFTAAMMGQMDVVKAMIAAQPGLQRHHGPHGITLMAHARAGGTPAEAVVRYLATLSDADIPAASAPLDAADRDALVGRYVFESGPRDWFDVDVERNLLGINRPGSPSRRILTHVGSLVFFPTGAPSVRIAFLRDETKRHKMTIADPDVLVTATRASG